MQIFLKYKELYLTQHEWAGGDAPSPKVNKERAKAVAKGEAELVTSADAFLSTTVAKKIARKIT